MFIPSHKYPGKDSDVRVAFSSQYRFLEGRDVVLLATVSPSLKEESANMACKHGLWAKFVNKGFVNKVFLEYLHTSSFSHYLWLLWFCNDRVEQLWQRSYDLQNLKYLLFSLLQKKFDSV